MECEYEKYDNRMSTLNFNQEEINRIPISTRVIITMYRINQLMNWNHTPNVEDIFSRIQEEDPDFLDEVYMRVIKILLNREY